MYTPPSNTSILYIIYYTMHFPFAALNSDNSPHGGGGEESIYSTPQVHLEDDAATLPSSMTEPGVTQAKSPHTTGPPPLKRTRVNEDSDMI